MKRAKLHTLNTQGFEKKMFAVLAFSIIVLAAFYIYFVSRSVINVLVREEIEQSIMEAHTHLADLEAEYLSKKNRIDTVFAQELGFSAVAQKSYVTRDTALTLQKP